MNDSFVIRVILIVLAALILYVLISQYNKSTPYGKAGTEKFYVDENVPSTQQYDVLTKPKKTKQYVVEQESVAENVPKSTSPKTVNGVLPSEPIANEDFKAIDFNVENKVSEDCYPKDRLTAEDLLPKDAANSKWAQVNPAGQGDVKDQNFLTAGFHIGINTIGQSLRNANLQLRSEPPNPKSQVSPWNQSTIEFDNSRRYFEVGEC
jgi:hypothetical protein